MKYEQWHDEILGKCNNFELGDISSTRCMHSMNYKGSCHYDVCPLVKYGN